MTVTRAPRKDVVVILNGISQRKPLFYKKFLPAISAVANVKVFETASPDEAISLAARAADKEADAVIAAGGDGTLNQVVHGVLAGREHLTDLPVIGLIPLGTGNDFAKSAGITASPQGTSDLLSSWQPRPVDVGKVSYTPFGVGAGSPAMQDRYFVNVADAGMGPEVVRRVSKSKRFFGEFAAYYTGILSTFATYELIKVRVTTPTWNWEGLLRSLAIANGKYYGHGLGIAPDASLNDQVFTVFICGNVSALDFVLQTPVLKRAQHVQLPEVLYKATTEASLTSDSACMIEADGEILGQLPARVSLADTQLRFLI